MDINMKPTTAFLFILFSCISAAQKITCSLENKAAFEAKIEAIKKFQDNTIGDTMVAVGKSFLGTPYVAKTLEVGTTESLVLNLQELDCTTFVENVLAFSYLLKNKRTHFDDFINTLETIRYKYGKLDGYSSRLHYFTDWIRNNQKKGLVLDITNNIGGSETTKQINFMSSHQELYPFLKDNDENVSKIKKAEDSLNQEVMCVLLQEDIAANEYLLQSGDIIALTTSIKGLDVTHTGIVIKQPDGRIHLLHASTTGAVKISKLPLVAYLKKIKHNTGIMVARVVFD